MDKTSLKLITIDGPSGAGKGTASRELAYQLGWDFLDSGALYRLTAYAAMQKKIDLEDICALVEVASTLDVEFKIEASHADPDVFLEGQPVTLELRTEACSSTASTISAYPAVRAALLQRQRNFLTDIGLVADGRDMGTVVFPHAPLKIYMTASPEVRAVRRHRQLLAQGIGVNMSHLLRDIIVRDQRDMSRAAAPLKPAEDALMLDTTEMDVTEVVQWIYRKAVDIWGEVARPV